MQTGRNIYANLILMLCLSVEYTETVSNAQITYRTEVEYILNFHMNMTVAERTNAWGQVWNVECHHFYMK